MNTTNTNMGDDRSESIQEDILSKYFDEHDFQIFKKLNENGRVSDTELTEEIDLSRSAIRRRREELLDRDMVDIHAVLVLQQLDLAYADVLVTLDHNASSEDRATLISKLIDEELIYSVESCLGDDDLFVRLWYESLSEIKSYTWTLFEDESIVDAYELVPMVHTWKAWDKPLDRPE